MIKGFLTNPLDSLSAFNKVDSQVKEKILDTTFKKSPFSTRF